MQHRNKIDNLTSKESTVPGKAAGRVAVELPWLCPNTESLIALADAPATVSGLSSADPALSCFLLRFAQFQAAGPNTFNFAAGAFHSALLPDTAAAYLAASSGGVLPCESSALARVRAVTEQAAVIASRIAETTQLVPGEVAATVARLVPLGWYAVASVDASIIDEVLRDSRFPERSCEVQAELWGLDHAAITRRLAARWRLPDWVATCLGCLTLPLRVAGHLVSHRDLFAIVQLAVLEAERQATHLGIAHGANRDELLAHLHLDKHTLEELAALPALLPSAPDSGLNPNPHRVPLVRNLLRMAAESRRRNGPGLVVRLEEQIDQLHRVAAELGDLGGNRLRDSKLAALAELAAGAGHEINNPLAVISGNAQRLLRTEPDPDRSESLRVVVRQTQRIAGILRDLMQFARPPRPESRCFQATELFDATRDTLATLAAERGVRLDLTGIPINLWVEGDPKQLRHALEAVTRNAIEATPSEGWVRVSCEAPPDGCDVVFTVEDSGPGLPPETAEHAFDPFYCGRSAGRGRGLGLPTAWQLLRQNGGDLRYDPTPDGPTRFSLTIRRAVGRDVLSLRSA